MNTYYFNQIKAECENTVEHLAVKNILKICNKALEESENEHKRKQKENIRTVEITDDLDSRVENCKIELLDRFKDYINENPDISDFDEFYQNSGCDSAHEIADSNTPIYYHNIDSLYYLYSSDFDEAYNNAGFGDGTEDNHKQVAIYCYLSEKTFDYMNELQEQFEDIFNEADNLTNEQVKKAFLLDKVNELEVE